MTPEDVEQRLENTQRALGLLHERVQELEQALDRLPNTNLLSQSFLTRAVAVFGHFSVVYIAFWLCFLLLLAVSG